MTEETLAQALVACEQWPYAIIQGDCRDRRGIRWTGQDDAAPDLTDDATVGVLLGMLFAEVGALNIHSIICHEMMKQIDETKRERHDSTGVICARLLIALWTKQ